jgi:hypothetical protein
MSMKNHILFCAGALAALQLAACAAPEGHEHPNFQAALSGDQEVPPTGSMGSGTAAMTLDRASNELAWRITYNSLSGPATAGHFHGPASPGSNAGPQVNFGDDLESPITGSTILTDAQEQEFLAGEWYVNIHTAAHPDGEIRGQVQ